MASAYVPQKSCGLSDIAWFSDLRFDACENGVPGNDDPWAIAHQNFMGACELSKDRLGYLGKKQHQMGAVIMAIKMTIVAVDDFILKSWSPDACSDEMLAEALAVQELIAVLGLKEGYAAE